MATREAQAPKGKPVAIAPAPADARRNGMGAHADSPRSIMPYTCQACARRKVKCDKAAPVCSTCRKGRSKCVYQAPVPRTRKRKPSLSGEDPVEKLARYEHILQQHGLLDTDPSPPAEEDTLEDRIFPLWNLPSGKLLVGHGTSRYVNSHLWRNLGDEEMEHMTQSDGAEEEGEEMAGEDGFMDEQLTPISGRLTDDPLTGAFIGSHQSLLQYHPSHTTAMFLWKTHMQNVEPLCKVLHIPSTTLMIETASQQPQHASKTEECLMFAVYHFAVSSMTEDDCATKLGLSRNVLLHRFHFATRQALVNASFLKTTAMAVLQALVLFLLACRHTYDPHTYWILTGIAARISQRMGLHRDGEKLGLAPFDVQMRRRLFYQVLPLDGAASRMSGTAVPAMPDSWDTQLPLNIDDDQIWPGMAEVPQEKKGATEMTFCLSRTFLGMFFAKPGGGKGPGQSRDLQESDRAVQEAENEVEERYIRYCDIVNPLHMLTISSARAGITATRLRIRLPKVRNHTATNAERRELFQLAQKILATDTATRAHAGLDIYRWHTRWFFLWGTWDSLLYILTTLWRRSDLLSSAETDAAWDVLEQFSRNHDEFLDSKRALYAAVGRLMLKAWATRPPQVGVPEPDFIVALRCKRETAATVEVKEKTKSADPCDDGLDAVLSHPWTPPKNSDGSLDDLEAADWMFWDQLLQDHQMEGEFK